MWIGVIDPQPKASRRLILTLVPRVSGHPLSRFLILNHVLARAIACQVLAQVPLHRRRSELPRQIAEPRQFAPCKCEWANSSDFRLGTNLLGGNGRAIIAPMGHGTPKLNRN